MKTLRDIQCKIQDSIIYEIKLESHDRLRVYQEAYFLRLLESLKVDYPRLFEVLGSIRFSKLVRDYLNEYPSNSYSLFSVGSNLADFIERADDFSEQHIELARIEWALHSVLNEVDEELLTLNSLQSIPPDAWSTYQFCLITAHRFLILSNNETLFIWRKKNQVFQRNLPILEAILLKKFLLNLNFSEVCDDLSQYLPENELLPFVIDRIQYWLLQEVFRCNHSAL